MSSTIFRATIAALLIVIGLWLMMNPRILFAQEEGTRITICVDTSPRDRDQRFRYETDERLDATSISDFSLTDDDERERCQTFRGLSAGLYIIEQQTPAHWNLDDIDCTGDDESDIDIDDEELRITLVLGESIRCEYLNERDAPPTATATPMPTATATPVTVSPPPPPAPTPSLPSFVNCGGGNIITVRQGDVGNCPTQAPVVAQPTATPVPPVANTIRPPSTGSGGLLPTVTYISEAPGDDSPGGAGATLRCVAYKFGFWWIRTCYWY